MKATSATDSGQLKLRLPSTLKDWLTDQASQNRRSLSSEVVVRLEESRERETKARKGEAPVIGPTEASMKTPSRKTEGNSHVEG